VALRVGYACVNTQLPSSSRTLRLANVTAERLRGLIGANLDALEAILRWNQDNGIDVFRLTSNLIPLVRTRRTRLRGGRNSVRGSSNSDA
jgi:UV DNA damage endonuclease